MDGTYERIIDLINKKPQHELARRVLLWIMYAQRPLTETELTYAVAMETSTRSEDDVKSMRSAMNTLVDVCANLITVNIDDRHTVRFVHFSVHEFLRSKSQNPSNGSTTTLNIDPDIGQVELAQMCITFMLFCGTPTSDCTHEYTAFGEYASTYWMAHVRAVNKINHELTKLIEDYFKFGPLIRNRASSWDAGGVLVWAQYRQEEHTRFSPHIIAHIFDFPLIANYLEEVKDTQSDYPDDKYAMHFAAGKNSTNAIARLCDQGFTVHDLDMNDRVPLYYATDIDTIRFLLDKGADVNAHGGYALLAAVMAKALEWMSLFNPQDGEFGFYALNDAILSGNEESVVFVNHYLGDNGYLMNQMHGDMGDQSGGLVQLLLDRGADVNAQVEGDNALYAAAAIGQRGIVQLLLDQGADVNAGGGEHGCALSAAVMGKREGIVRLLLGRGADVNAQGGFFGNALQAAASVQQLDIVQLFLDQGADVNAQGGHFGNALQTAVAKRERDGMVELLLDRGADVNAQGGHFGNALQAAADRGRRGVVELLLDRGADINAQGGHHGSALRATRYASKSEIRQLLLDRGAVESDSD